MQWGCKQPLGAVTNLCTHSCSSKDVITLGCYQAVCVRITLCSTEAGNTTEKAEMFGKTVLEHPKCETCANLTCLLNRSYLVCARKSANCHSIYDTDTSKTLILLISH